MSFREIAKAKYSDNRKALYESSLSRIWQHVKDADNQSLAIITSWRQNYSKKKNIQGFNDLKKSIRNLGLGFVVVKGHWKECQDPNVSYSDCPEDQLVDAVEPSLFIPGITKEQAVKLGIVEHKQDAIVFAGPESNGRVILIFNDGNTMDIGDFKPQSMGQAFTELRKSKQSTGRYFKFEGVEYQAQNYIENLIEQEVRKVMEK